MDEGHNICKLTEMLLVNGDQYSFLWSGATTFEKLQNLFTTHKCRWSCDIVSLKLTCVPNGHNNWSRSGRDNCHYLLHITWLQGVVTLEFSDWLRIFRGLNILEVTDYLWSEDATVRCGYNMWILGDVKCFCPIRNKKVQNLLGRMWVYFPYSMEIIDLKRYKNVTITIYSVYPNFKLFVFIYSLYNCKLYKMA